MREGRWSTFGDVAAVCLLVAALATLVTFALVGVGHDEVAGLVAAGSIAALAVVIAANHARELARARERRATVDALAALESVMEPAVASLPAADLLDEVLVRTKEALGAEVAWVLVTGAGHRDLEVRSSTGTLTLAPVGATAPGRGLLQSLVRAGGPAVLGDALRLELAPRDAPALASLASCPLLVDGRLLGALVVGASRPSVFGTTELRVLGVAAERIAEVVERSRLDEAERRSRLGSEHAHLHLRVLARAGAVLGSALESIEPALVAIGDVVVPDFADWFSVDALDAEGTLTRMTASWTARGITVTRSPTPSRPIPSPHPWGDQLVRLALAEMRPQLVVHTDRLGDEIAGARVHDATRMSKASHPTGPFDSVLIVPMRVGDTFSGALTFMRVGQRRGYRPSDVECAGELVDRVAVAVERVASLRQSQRAAEEARRDAQRLGRLVEASLVVNAQLAESEVLELLAEHAQQVLGAAAVVVAAPVEGEVVVVAEWPPSPAQTSSSLRATRRAARQRAVVARASRDVRRAGRSCRELGVDGASWIAVPLPDTEGATRGTVVALASDDEVFDDDDESVLTLLAQLASVALQNAHLYDRVSSNERRLQAVVQASPLAIAELRPNGELRWGNRAAGDLFGPDGPLSSLSDKPHGSGISLGGAPGLVLADDEVALVGLLEKACDGTSTVGLAVSAERPDGERRELSVSASPLVDDGEVTGVLLIAEDVTERRRMLEQVHQSERLAATSRMAGALAHDFNNLLTVILGCSEVLSRELHDDDALHDIAAIRRAGARAAELTGQLLRIGQGRPAQVEIVDVHDVVAAMRPMLASVLGREIDLVIGPGHEAACAALDRADLERAVLNLAINARDAMPEGGSFTIEVTVRPHGDGMAIVDIAFTDTGTGMDADTVAHCLEPLFTTKPRGRGTGLGLATVHATVTQADGKLTIESEVGKGTSIVISFPARVPERRTPTAATHARRGHRAERARISGTAGASGTVLFVDDESELVRLASRVLEDAGFSVVSAHSAGEALRIVEASGGSIDLLVTDAVMPGMGGGELAAAALRSFPQLPVLFMSGYLDAGEPGRLELPDGAEVLEKPYSSDELVRRVRATLDAARRADRWRGGRRAASGQGSKR